MTITHYIRNSIVLAFVLAACAPENVSKRNGSPDGDNASENDQRPGDGSPDRSEHRKRQRTNDEVPAAPFALNRLQMSTKALDTGDKYKGQKPEVEELTGILEDETRVAIATCKDLPNIAKLFSFSLDGMTPGEPHAFTIKADVKGDVSTKEFADAAEADKNCFIGAGDDEQYEATSFNDPYFKASKYAAESNLGDNLAYLKGLVKPDEKVVIGVIDSGVDMANADLAPSIRTTHLEGSNRLRGDPNLPADEHGHGTAVASIIGATPNNGEQTAGLAAGVAQIQPIKILDHVPEIPDYIHFQSQFIHNAIVHAVRVGSDIIVVNIANAHHATCDPLVGQAIYYASILKRKIVVVPAGQSVITEISPGLGSEAPGRVFAPSNFGSTAVVGGTSSPACMGNLPGVIAVAGTDKNELATFSNYGEPVEITAPAAGIEAPGLGGAQTTFNGTSFATPQVASALAYILAAHRSQGWHIGPDYAEDVLLAGSRFNSNLAGLISGARSLDWDNLVEFMKRYKDLSQEDKLSLARRNADKDQGLIIAGDKGPLKHVIATLVTAPFARPYDRVQLQALAFYTNGSVKVVTEEAEWSVSAPRDAKEVARGQYLFREFALGAYEFSATFGGMKASTEVHVVNHDPYTGDPDDLVGIELEESGGEFKNGDSVPFFDAWKVYPPRAYAVYNNNYRRRIDHLVSKSSRRDRCPELNRGCGNTNWTQTYFYEGHKATYSVFIEPATYDSIRYVPTEDGTYSVLRIPNHVKQFCRTSCFNVEGFSPQYENGEKPVYIPAERIRLYSESLGLDGVEGARLTKATLPAKMHDVIAEIDIYSTGEKVTLRTPLINFEAKNPTVETVILNVTGPIQTNPLYQGNKDWKYVLGYQGVSYTISEKYKEYPVPLPYDPVANPKKFEVVVNGSKPSGAKVGRSKSRYLSTYGFPSGTSLTLKATDVNTGRFASETITLHGTRTLAFTPEYPVRPTYDSARTPRADSACTASMRSLLPVAGGDGSPEKPLLVCTQQQLLLISQEYKRLVTKLSEERKRTEVYAKLADNIDLSSLSSFKGIFIGDDDLKIGGYFFLDGDGYELSGATVVDGEYDNVGIIRPHNHYADIYISNLGFRSIAVRGNRCVGAVGKVEEVINSYCTDCTVTGALAVGGLAGCADYVERSYVDKSKIYTRKGAAAGLSPARTVVSSFVEDTTVEYIGVPGGGSSMGGLGGTNIINSYARDVYVRGGYYSNTLNGKTGEAWVGGLSAGGSLVYKSFVENALIHTAGSGVGGLLGSIVNSSGYTHAGMVHDSHAINVEVIGGFDGYSSCAGGLVGFGYNPIIEKSSAQGVVTGYDGTAGLIGCVTGLGNIVDNSADVDIKRTEDAKPGGFTGIQATYSFETMCCDGSSHVEMPANYSGNTWKSMPSTSAFPDVGILNDSNGSGPFDSPGIAKQ